LPGLPFRAGPVFSGFQDFSMSERQAQSFETAPALEAGMGDPQDYLALLKPRVMSLVIFTAFAGMIAAPGTIHPWTAFVALLAIAVGAGASGALNMWYDADIDAVMERTRRRPLPAGRLLAGEALGFGLTLSIGSVAVLGLLVNVAAAAILAFTIFFYAVIYTMWLKRTTAQNIVIGGAAGAFPPMIGWAAVTGGVDMGSIALFLIIFMWTPPHFWALSLYRQEDYARANIPMLPVVAGEDETRRQILIYSILLMPLSLLPAALGTAGALYVAVTSVLGVLFMIGAIQVWRVREGKPAVTAAKRFFGFSILYLFLVFAALIVERVVGIASFGALI
jgi:protoheme IX farnesyltransferase